MEKETTPVARHPLFEFLAANPQVLSAHAAWLSAGGEKIIELLIETMGGDSFPYSAEQHVQASFGAFCGGGAFFGKTLKRLVAVVNNRKDAIKMLIQSDGSIPADERAILLRHYGYTDEELKKAAAPKPARKPKQEK